MRAGALRHRILVEEPIASQNETGEEIEDWLSHGRKWGAVEPLRGREQLQGSQINAPFDTRIRIRWSRDVDRMNAKWRLTHLDVVYNIVSIAADPTFRREFEVLATSGINRG